MDMQVIINQMIVLFILLGLGYFAGKINLLTAEGVKALSKVVLNITMPCTILNSVINGELNTTAGEMAYFAFISLMAVIVPLIVVIPAVRVLGGDKNKHGIYRYLAAFGNVANMGFPVTMAILGAISAFYVAIFNIPYILICYSIGALMVSGKTGKFDIKILLNPSLIAGIAIVLIVLTGFEAPGIIANPIMLVHGITTPGAMLIIGASLARISFKDTLSDWRLYAVVLFKLILMPVIIWLIFRQIVSNELMLGVLVILSGMASGAMATIFAIEYGGDEHVASSGVFLTTLLSGITIPLIVFLLLA